MRYRVWILLIALALLPCSAAEQPTSFELPWSDADLAPIRIDPGVDGGIVVSSVHAMEDASVPLSEIFCVQKNEASRANCLAEDPAEIIRVWALKWIYVDGTRHLFIAWSPLHTCTADEPNYYFKVVDGADFSRELAFAAKLW